MRSTVVLIGALLSMAPQSAAAQRRPPEPYVDRNVCPFECCTYREWTADHAIVIYREPTARAQPLGRLRLGERFQALTGDVHFQRVGVVALHAPGQLEVDSGPPQRVPARDTVYVLSSLGEGYYKIWYRGRVYASPSFWDDPNVYPRPTGEPGRLIRAPREIWWVKIRSQRGQLGWIRMDRAEVTGADQCGGPESAT